MRPSDQNETLPSIGDLADLVVERAENQGVPIGKVIHIVANEYGVTASEIGRELGLRAQAAKLRERREILEFLYSEKIECGARQNQEALVEGFRITGHEDDL
ncbi:MAG: hypothetical protein WCQ00_03625 [bacterium]